jgi:Tfp pilus assembly protein PilX
MTKLPSDFHVQIHRQSADRRGVVLAAALVAFLATAAVLFALLKTVVNHQREVRDQRQSLQAQALADAGIDRGVAQLRRSDAYRGETWHVPDSQLDGTATADVEIRVEAVADHPDQLHLFVQADYPSDPIHRARQSRQATIKLKSPQSE